MIEHVSDEAGTQAALRLSNALFAAPRNLRAPGDVRIVLDYLADSRAALERVTKERDALKERVDDIPANLEACQFFLDAELKAERDALREQLKSARREERERFRVALEIVMGPDGTRRCSHCGGTNVRPPVKGRGWTVIENVEHSSRCPLADDPVDDKEKA